MSASGTVSGAAPVGHGEGRAEGQGRRALITVLPGAACGPDMFKVDLCERTAVAAVIEQVRPDVVVHLAGIAFVAHADAAPKYRVNVAGTRNLLEATPLADTLRWMCAA